MSSAAASFPSGSPRPHQRPYVIELWAQSNLPRYRPGSACGQPTAAADLARQILFSSDATGRIAGDALSVSETGTLIAYSAKGVIQISETRLVNVYVAVQIDSGLYFRQADGGWTRTQAPLFNFVAPGAANFDVMRDFDTRGLPPGATLYVGYGATPDDVVANRQYKAVHTF